MPQRPIALDLADVQGIIHHDYQLPYSRHLLFEVKDRRSGRKFLKFLAPRATHAAAPSAAESQRAVNIGITFRGLQTLGVPDEILNEFPVDFKNLPFSNREGDATLGDFGASAPRNWWNNKFETEQIHLIVHVYSRSDGEHDALAESIRERAQAAGVAELIPTQDGLPIESRPLGGADGRVHFGYRDGIAQPQVNWDDDPGLAGKTDFRHFLLGYSNDAVPSSPFRGAASQFARNGSYSAFRWMYQDVARFNKFLEAESPTVAPHLTPAQAQEWLAAKLVGRWRDGTPLALSPDGPDAALSTNDDFLYADDPRGEKCPFQAHIRICNPRDQELGFAEQIDGGVPRIIRRGVPYGTMLEGTVDDGQQRGLAGIFLCASLTRQVFKLLVWMSETNFSPVFTNNHGQDMLARRSFPNANATFSIATPGGIKTVTLLDFVRTDGTAFFLLPSLTTLRQLT